MIGTSRVCMIATATPAIESTPMIAAVDERVDLERRRAEKSAGVGRDRRAIGGGGGGERGGGEEGETGETQVHRGGNRS